MGRRVLWTDAMLDYLRTHYADEPACDIADVLGVASTTVSNKARELGLVKSSSFDAHSYMGRYTHKYGYKNK